MGLYDGLQDAFQLPEGDSTAVPVNAYLQPYSRVEGSRIDALQPGFQSGLERALSDMPENLRSSVHIDSAYRSPQDQAAILRRMLPQHGLPVNASTLTRGLPGLAAGVDVDANGNVVGSHSRHAQGAAVDIDASPEAMRWLYANSGRYGFENPSSLRGSDPGHFQLLNPGDGGGTQYASAAPSSAPSSGFSLASYAPDASSAAPVGGSSQDTASRAASVLATLSKAFQPKQTGFMPVAQNVQSAPVGAVKVNSGKPLSDIG